MDEHGRAAVEQIFVNLVQVVGANNVLITNLTAEIKGLREDMKGREKDASDLIDNSARLGEDIQELTGGFRMGLELLHGAAEAGKKGRVCWSDIVDIFTRIALEAQEEDEGGGEGEGEQQEERKTLPQRD
jgi:hypothetical protein